MLSKLPYWTVEQEVVQSHWASLVHLEAPPASKAVFKVAPAFKFSRHVL